MSERSRYVIVYSASKYDCLFYPLLSIGAFLFQAKKDNAKKTGAAGGKDKKFTPVDDIVLEIIGTESPIIEGIGVQDLLGDKQQDDDDPLLSNLCPKLPNFDDDSLQSLVSVTPEIKIAKPKS